MKLTSIVILVVAIGLTAFLVTRFRSSRSSSTSAPEPSSSLKGQIAPDFALESLDGKTVRLSDFQGRGVVLNFWATWCQPCKIEMPWFEQLQKHYGPEGLQVLGIAMDDASKKDIAEFASKLRIDYPILLGNETVGEAYGGIQFLPVTIYIGRNGTVIEKVFGLKGRDEIERSVKKTLGRSR